MRKIEVRDYHTGELVKIVRLNRKAEDSSISFNIENDKLVIRDYYNGEVLQRAKVPSDIGLFFNVKEY